MFRRMSKLSLVLSCELKERVDEELGNSAVVKDLGGEVTAEVEMWCCRLVCGRMFFLCEWYYLAKVQEVGFPKNV